MYDESALRAIMKKRLKKKRFIHTEGVVETAEYLARLHGTSPEKARIAALVHDYAKGKEKIDYLQAAEQFGLAADDVMQQNPDLLHGEIGACLLKRDHGIVDEDILNAIRYHTYGRRGMSVLEQIIYLADAIEPGRSYPGVEALRKLAEVDLQAAVKAAVGHSITYVVGKDALLHPNSIELWNEMLGGK